MGLLLKWAIFAVYTALVEYLAFIFGRVYEDREKLRNGADTNE